MTTYLVTATVVDEACIAERQGAGNEFLSRDYIPGTALWGAMANLTGIGYKEEPNGWFRHLFYSGEVIFTNLYPMCGVERSHPVPLSARTRKSAPGFNNAKAEPIFTNLEGEHLPPAGVTDWLYNGPPDVYDPDIEPISGWYLGSPPNSETVSVNMTLRGHNDRSGPTGTTREGLLFFRQNMARGQEFQGALRAVTNDGENSLERLIQSLGSGPLEIPVGRQPGHVRIELEKIEEEPYWQLVPAIKEENVSILTVTLLSDAILLDPWLRPLSFLSEKYVAASLGLEPNSVSMEQHFSTLREVLGWNGAYSRPREVETAVSAGSAFLYLIDWPEEVGRQERVRRLTEWQRRGIGLRTVEGFGEIRINDPFHPEYGKVVLP